MQNTRLFEKLNEAPVVFALLRATTVAVGLLGTLLALILVNFGLFALSTTPTGMDNVAGAAGIATVVLVSLCCYAALIAFFRLCGRLSRGSAFTRENAEAMRRIARLLLAAGIAVLTGLLAVGLMVRGLTVTLLWCSSFALAFLGASLLAHALSVLVRRAAALQDDCDLTV